MELQAYEQIKRNFDAYQKEIITVRTSDYKGKGRPRKSDFVRIPRGNLRDFRCFEIFKNGFSTEMYEK